MKEVDIAAMTFPEMDADDGLQVAQQIGILFLFFLCLGLSRAFVEFTVADLDNDLDDDHNCVGGAYTQDHAHGVNPIGAVTATLKEVCATGMASLFHTFNICSILDLISY